MDRGRSARACTSTSVAAQEQPLKATDGLGGDHGGPWEGQARDQPNELALDHAPFWWTVFLRC